MNNKFYESILNKNANYINSKLNFHAKTSKFQKKHENYYYISKDKMKISVDEFLLSYFSKNQDKKKEIFKWNKEQREAIDEREKNLLVSASAGSGKTTVMTQRIIEIIDKDKVPINEFLIVTFTSASAQDMKAKIIEKLYKLPQDDFILKQIDNVAISDISDLHSFYLRLVTTYFYEVDLDPNFKIMDPIQVNLLKERAIQSVFDNAEQTDKDFFRLFDIFQSNRSDTSLRDIIFSLSEFLAAHVDGNAWFDDNINLFYNDDIEQNLAAINLKNQLLDFAENAIRDMQEFLELCPGCEIYNIYFQNLITTFGNFSKEKSFKENSKILFDIKFDALRTPKNNYVIFHEQAVELQTYLKERVSEFKKFFVSTDFGDLASQIRVAKKDLLLIYNYTKSFDETFSKLKRDIGVLDFNDLERYALKILSNPTICEAVRNKYKYVFIDEYQDINEVQEKILTLVSQPNNRFMVGDIKQSIYGFRLCDPEIFLNKYNKFSNDDKMNKVIKLNCNFRCDRKILKFVDDIFSKFMTKRFGGIDYAHESIFIPSERNTDIDRSVNLCFIDTGKDEEAKTAEGIYSIKEHKNDSEIVSKGKLEARLVAQKISEIIKENVDNDEKIKFSDIAILYFLTSKNFVDFIDELKKLKIPISVDRNGDLMQKSYIREILNFVKICVNERDDFVLFNVLKSKLFNFSEDEIVQLRLTNRSLPFNELLGEVEKIADINLRMKFQNFLQIVSKYKKIAQIMTIRDFCKLIVSDFDLLKLNLIDIDGKSINDDIEVFLASLPETSVTGFLTNYENFSIDSTFSGGEDCVNIMTVHKSKGMEFNYVFIINTGGPISYKSLKSKILMDKHNMIGVNYYDYDSRREIQTLPMSMCKIAIKKKIAEEQLRVFYVALTRAKRKLFVLCSKDSQTLKEKPKYLPNSYSDWIDFLILGKMNGDKNLDYINFEKYCTKDFLSDKNLERPSLLFCKENVPDFETLAYDYFGSTNIPLKNSVSKILKNHDRVSIEDDFDDNYEKQESDFSQELIVSSANRGTAYHKFFQHFDFSNLQNIESQFDGILNILSDEEKQYIDLQICTKILHNEIFKQLSGKKIFKEREFFAEIPANFVDKDAYSGDKIIMQGVVDLFAISDDEIFILDYKTGKNTPEKLEKYKFQLNMYADICCRAFQKPVTSKILCFIDEGEFIKI